MVLLQHCVERNELPLSFLSCQEVRPFHDEENFERGSKKREPDDMRRSYIQEKLLTVIELWECEWTDGRCTRQSPLSNIIS